MGPKLPQNLRFIGFSFTTNTLLVKCILRIFQTQRGILKVPPVSQFTGNYRVRHSMKITDHTVLNFNRTIFMAAVSSDTRKASDATFTLAFRKVVKIKILIGISTLINSCPSSRKFKLSVKSEIHTSSILFITSNWQCYYTIHFKK
jgi:hypothetical protein